MIPIQFVFFTLSAITGSAILYGDFKKAGFHAIITFLYGCAATFIGVFIIANGTTSDREEHVPHIICPDGEVQDGSRLGMGTIGKKCHTTLQTPIPRKRNSSVGVVGIISPAQVCPSLLPVVSQGFTSFIESNYSLHILQLENLLSYLEKGRLDTKTAISRARLAHMDVIEVYLAS